MENLALGFPKLSSSLLLYYFIHLLTFFPNRVTLRSHSINSRLASRCFTDINSTTRMRLSPF